MSMFAATGAKKRWTYSRGLDSGIEGDGDTAIESGSVPPFKIHVYGENLQESVGTGYAGESAKKTFATPERMKLKDAVDLFKAKYDMFYQKNKKHPVKSDCYKFGLPYTALTKVLDFLVANHEANIIERNSKWKDVVLKGYESPKAPETIGMENVHTAYETLQENHKAEKPARIRERKDMRTAPEDDKIEKIIRHPLARKYMLEILGTNGAGEEEVSEKAIKIIKTCAQSGKSDLKVAEDEKLIQNDARHYLTVFNEKGIISFKSDIESNGYRTDFWYSSRIGLENLKRHSAEMAEEEIKSFEAEIEDGKNGKYACEKFSGEHPVFDFGSDIAEENKYKCQACGAGLIFTTGEDLAKPVESKISRLRESIEELKQMEV